MEGLSTFDILDGELEELFCSSECERRFWEARADYQGVLDHLLQARSASPDFWRGKGDVWDEQFNLAWWHLARHMGVRPYATDPDPAKWHEHYFAVGRVIARAAEWESASESALAMFMNEPLDQHRGLPVSVTLGKWRTNAHRWPHAEGAIRQMCDAATDAVDLRHYLVHSFVVPSWSGDGAQLEKPVRKQGSASIRHVRLREIELLAARFHWLFEALNRILNNQDPEGPVSWAGDLGPPPPLES